VVNPAPTPRKDSRAARVEKPRTLKWHHHLAAFAIFAGFRLISMTWRMRLIDPHNVLQRTDGPVIACIWHNRLALSMRTWEQYVRPNIPCAGLVALISASHDGGVLARVLKYFDVEAARGSSSRRGGQALLELTSWAQRNYTIAITPDGPRGPRYEIRDGIVGLAQVSGRPIMPVSSYVNWKFCLRSWDRFQIPLPFARCEMRIGELIVVPRDISESERAPLKQELRNRMHTLTRD